MIRKIEITSWVKIGCIFLLLISFFVIYTRTLPVDEREVDYSMPADHDFIGDKSCKSCHIKEWQDWKGSHHDYAMMGASEESVRGNFNDITFYDGGESYLFYREEDKFMIRMMTLDGDSSSYEVLYTFGWEPLQQYLIDFEKGKFQAFHIAWDTDQEEWFSLNPDQPKKGDNWLHWTGGAMNWNMMCASCHSTNLSANYIAEADSFYTTWSSINVSCEACHGPGREHEAFMNQKSNQRDPAGNQRDLGLAANFSQLTEIDTCASCHSLRQGLTNDFVHGEPFMDHFDPVLPHPQNYFSDGQIHEEAFEYGSFLQSKMFLHGVKCTDCHNPHTLRLKETIADNKLCMQCHAPEYNSANHHFHSVNTEASQCINCHMPGRYYMEKDFRRDHSFRIPRPDLTEKFNTPNACNDCHSNESSEWASKAIERWYGEDRRTHFSETFSEIYVEGRQTVPDLGSIIADTTLPVIVRATAVWYAGQFPDQDSFEIIQQALTSEHPMIRSSAAKASANLPGSIKKSLLTKILKDTVRAVRLSAVQGLTEFSVEDFSQSVRPSFQQALREYKEQLKVNEYFPQGQMNTGQFYENRGEIDEAMNAYRKALNIDPHFFPAHMNLAFLYNSQGENLKAKEHLRTIIEQEPDHGEAYYTLGLVLAEENKLQEALYNLKAAVQLMSDNSRVVYNLAVLLQTLNQSQEAESAYQTAIRLDPDNVDFRHGIVSLYLQQEKPEHALEHVVELNRLLPDDLQVQQLLRFIQESL